MICFSEIYGCVHKLTIKMNSVFILQNQGRMVVKNSTQRCLTQIRKEPVSKFSHRSEYQRQRKQFLTISANSSNALNDFSGRQFQPDHFIL